ncbi:hypothetical protein ACLB2K_044289 [Fragaria x ananassa]
MRTDCGLSQRHLVSPGEAFGGGDLLLSTKTPRFFARRLLSSVETSDNAHLLTRERGRVTRVWHRQWIEDRQGKRSEPWI